MNEKLAIFGTAEILRNFIGKCYDLQQNHKFKEKEISVGDFEHHIDIIGFMRYDEEDIKSQMI